jgi:hypothetical protein
LLRRALLSVLRVAVAIALILAIAAVLIRQPVLTSLPFPGTAR